MVEFRNVLCPVDLTEGSLGPLAYAGALAGWYGASLTVLHVVPTFEPMQVRPARLVDPVRLVAPMPREEVLGEVRRVISAAGVSTRTAIAAAEAGDPAEVIVDQALAISADLVVMGTHGRTGFDRMLLGSVTEKVLRTAACPVLTIPPHAPATAPAHVAFRRILCAMDFRPSALQGLGFALDLARQGNGSVAVLHAIESLAEREPRANVHFTVAEYKTHLVELARERLQSLLAEEARSGSEIEPVVIVGRADRAILEAAADRAVDLIVMGAQGRGGVGLTLFGSTTQHVIRAAPCAVLTVRAAQPFPL